MKWRLIFLLCFLAVQSVAQLNGALSPVQRTSPDTVWIITGKRELGPAYRRFKLDLSLDGRQTLIGTQRARVGGVRVGLEYRRVHRVGIGLYGLGEGVVLDSLPEIDKAITWANLTLAYQSVYYERVLYFSRKWEWSATAHYGRGVITGVYRRLGTSETEALQEQKLRVVEFSTLGYYNLNYWCSIGVGVGYRYMLSTAPEIRDVYEAPVGLVRVRFKVGKLIKSLWDKDTKNLY